MTSRSSLNFQPSGQLVHSGLNCDKNKIPKIPDDLRLKINLLETKYNKFSLGKNLTNEMRCIAIRKMLLVKNNELIKKNIYPLKK